MIVAGEYSDEGKSGKSVEGRPQFQQMLSDIENEKNSKYNDEAYAFSEAIIKNIVNAIL